MRSARSFVTLAKDFVPQRMDSNDSNTSSIAGTIVIPQDNDNLALCAIITVVMQLSFYLVACTCKLDIAVETVGASNFVVLAIVTFGLSGVSQYQNRYSRLRTHVPVCSPFYLWYQSRQNYYWFSCND